MAIFLLNGGGYFFGVFDDLLIGVVAISALLFLIFLIVARLDSINAEKTKRLNQPDRRDESPED